MNQANGKQAEVKLSAEARGRILIALEEWSKMAVVMPSYKEEAALWSAIAVTATKEAMNCLTERTPVT